MGVSREAFEPIRYVLDEAAINSSYWIFSLPTESGLDSID